MPDTPFWMLRAGRGGANVDAFVEKGVAALACDYAAPVSPNMTKPELLAAIHRERPGQKEGAVASAASQLLRFIHEVQVGDTAVTYAPDRREYIIGRVSTGYEHLPEGIDDHPHARHIEWTQHAPRSALKLSSRNTLGSTLTIFRINDETADDLIANAKPLDQELDDPPPGGERPKADDTNDEVETPDQLLDETIEKAAEFLADRISRLDWEEMQELVAGLLRGMGYRTKVSPPGADRGCDVFASPDGLGLQDPRIFVEVKHRRAAMGSTDLRSFLGGRQAGDRCLYVSTGGFTKEARYEADRSAVPVRLLTLTDLAELVSERYEDLDDQTRTLIPLRRIYWPAD